jgi:hypothetical protein
MCLSVYKSLPLYQGLKFIFFVSIPLLDTGCWYYTVSILPHPIQICFHNSHCYKLQLVIMTTGDSTVNK